MKEYEIDLNAIMVKPLYLGLLINIFIPMVVVGIIYYIDQSGGFGLQVSEETKAILYWALIIMAVLDGVASVIIKQKRFFSPMIRSKETFAEDLTRGFISASLLCFALTSAIIIYGIIAYIIGGSFQHLLFFALLSFVAFQLIRPRHGFLKKVIAAQEEFVEEDRFAE